MAGSSLRFELEIAYSSSVSSSAGAGFALFACCLSLFAFLLYAFAGRSPDLVLLFLYSPCRSTWDCAESAGQPDFRLQEGAKSAINAMKNKHRMFFMP